MVISRSLFRQQLSFISLEADIFFSPDNNCNLNLPTSPLHEKAWLICSFAFNFVFQMNAANKWNNDLFTTTESHFDINHFKSFFVNLHVGRTICIQISVCGRPNLTEKVLVSNYFGKVWTGPTYTAFRLMHTWVVSVVHALLSGIGYLLIPLFSWELNLSTVPEHNISLFTKTV